MTAWNPDNQPVTRAASDFLWHTDVHAQLRMYLCPVNALEVKVQYWSRTALLVLGLCLVPQAYTESTTPQADAHGVHGMVLFGEPGRLFVSHLPLYRHPHDWQVVLELEPESAAGESVIRAQLADSGLLTLQPEPFDLFRLKPGAGEPLMRFTAALYRGHFERGGESLAELGWRVKRTWFFEPVVARSGVTDHRYLVVGAEADRQWLLHRVERRPDVDQILRIEATATLAGVLTAPSLLDRNSADTRFRVTATVWQDTDDLQ